MVRKNKVELYEVLSNHLLTAGHSVADPLDESALLSRRRGGGGDRSGREIVFSLDAAFVIFVVVLLLIGTAFFMGFRRGKVEARSEFINGIAGKVVNASSEIGIIPEDSSRIPGGYEQIPSGKFTLRLFNLPRTPESFEKMRKHRELLMADGSIASSRLNVLVFDNRQSYTLAVGLFDKREDDVLRSLKTFFKEGAGASPDFKEISVESASDLGTPIL